MVSADILGLQSAPSFAITDSDCGAELAAGQSCTAAVRFELNGYGRRDETITLWTGARRPCSVRVLGGLMTPQLTVAFAASSVKLLEMTRLRLTFINTNTAQALFDVGLNGQLPDGLALVDGPPEFTPACGSPTPTRGPDGNAFALNQATLAAGQTCVIELAVQAVLSGAQEARRRGREPRRPQRFGGGQSGRHRRRGRAAHPLLYSHCH